MPRIFRPHRTRVFVLTLFGAFSALAAETPAVSDERVDLRKMDYSIQFDEPDRLREPIPEERKCLLDPRLAEAVARAQSDLRILNLSLRVLRCNRNPRALTLKCKVPLSHLAGNTIDVTLVEKDGTEKIAAAPDLCRCENKTAGKAPSAKSSKAIETLRDTLNKQGLVSTKNNWWHFQLKD